MSEIKVEMFKASKGDCFLISLIDVSEKKYILIDGGFYETYDDHLMKRLKELAEEGSKLSLVVVTHIDSDHIEGILELFEENNKNTRIINIDEIWHNSYRHLQFRKKEILHTLDEREIGLLENIVNQNSSTRKETSNEDSEISAEQGSSLASLIYKGNYNWNTKFNGLAVSTDNNKIVSIDENIVIHILSPNNEKLNNLKKYWIRELRKEKYNFKLNEDSVFDDAYEFYLMNQKNEIEINENKDISNKEEETDLKEYLNIKENMDSSPTNGSSISFILVYKKRKLLFLGDSHADIIIQELKRNLNIPNEKIFFDLIKISHHGSRRNTNRELLDIIDSNNFLISTNGETHKHPHNEVIAEIVCRPTKYYRNLIFNYNQNDRVWDKDSNQDAYKYKVHYPNNKHSITVTYRNKKVEVD